MGSKIFADLHNHTTASDGDFPPEKLVKQARDLGLKALGITDHDTLKGLEKAVRAGEDSQIEIIPGVEVSIRFKRPFFTGTLHMLCYFSPKRLTDSSFVQAFESILANGRGKDWSGTGLLRLTRSSAQKGIRPC